jgi:GT2 family glycosyltransferase
MTNSKYSLAVAIPTKNRPQELATTVASVLSQTIRPQQLIIVDQGVTDESRRRITALFKQLRPEVHTLLELSYVQDVSLTGLTAARNRALTLVTTDIVLFLDDDVVLEPTFIEQLLQVFRNTPGATGVSGIITNYTAPPIAARCWIRLFMRGPFLDDRQPVYWNADKLRGRLPIRVTRLGGGLMAFSMAAIDGIAFDENLRGPCPGEDVEFCSRLGPGAVLLITPNARLVHNHSPTGRSAEHWLFQHAWTMGYLYHRNWRHAVSNRFFFIWLNIGYMLGAVISMIRQVSLAPWRGWAKARRDARNSTRIELTAKRPFQGQRPQGKSIC